MRVGHVTIYTKGPRHKTHRGRRVGVQKSKRVNNELTGAKNWRTGPGAQKTLEDTGLTQRQKTDESNKEEEHKGNKGGTQTTGNMGE